MIIVSDGEENVKPYVSEVVDEVMTISDWGGGCHHQTGEGVFSVVTLASESGCYCLNQAFSFNTL